MKEKIRNLFFFIILDAITKVIKWWSVTVFNDYQYNFADIIFLVSLLNIFLSFLVIAVYDFLEKDLVWLEHIKMEIQENKEITESSVVTGKIVWLVKRLGNNFLLLIILVGLDPILTVLYRRKGHHKWNLIPDIETADLFFISSIICTFTFTWAVNLLLKILYLISTIV